MIERLRTALGNAYVVERELGGGGMSRVFLAEERALGRKVVIKTLPPEIAAGISTDRFRREVQLAASLQHPHIVPVLATGEADGLLWYSMPHVEGQSLRSLLERQGTVPTGTAIRLLRDIADALEHAHAKGVVHRDIKPENVLLSGNHAVVTDFGIAKALATARQEGADNATTEGLVIGTPAYMAPEQAAGDPRVDQRADLYALGAVGYEMLAGAPVFSRPTPQAMIAAHIAETPIPLDKVKPGIPSRLSQLVMFCLAKEPARRPSAAAVRTTLETLGPAAVISRRRVHLLGAAAVLLLLAITSVSTGLWPRRSLVERGLFRDRDRIIVAQVDNRTRDSTLGMALTQALRVDLTQSDIMRVVSDQEVLASLARAQREPGSPLTEALSREIAQREGVQAVVAADISQVGSGYLLSARVLSPADGSVLAAVREDARSDGELLEALGRLSRELRRKIGESLRSIAATAPLERVTTSSLEALRQYSLALEALDLRRDIDRGKALLREAIGIDSGFAMAWRKLGIQLSNEGKRAQSVAALTAAYRHRERLAGTERMWTEASYYSTVTFQMDRAIRAHRAILDVDSLDWRAMNNLALAYYRNGQPAQAELFFRRSIAVDSNRLSPWTNLVEILGNRGKLAEAESALAQATLRFPGDRAVGWAAVQLRYQRGGVPAAERALSEVLATQGSDPEQQRIVAEVRGSLATTRGALREAGRNYQAAKRQALALDDLESFYDALFNEALGLIMILEARDSAIGLLRQALREHPLASMEELDRPFLEYAYAYAMAGRTDSAKAMVTAFERIPVDLRRWEEPFYYSVLAMIGMAEKRFDEALEAADRITRKDDCPSCLLAERAMIWDRSGDVDSAVQYYERFLSNHDINRVYTDAAFLPIILLRLGELYEEKGAPEKALDYYGRFVELWKEADPELAPRVTEVRKRMAALTVES